MPAILRQVDSIIIEGIINQKETNNFNFYQLVEENEKIVWVENNPDFSESLFTLEDHELLRGQVAIIGLEHTDLFDRFSSLFNCNWDLVDCALMSLGNYLQRERNEWRYQGGSSHIGKAWVELFHKSSNVGFENTKEVLFRLLKISDSFSDEMLEDIISDYMLRSERELEFQLEYYYIKYPAFRPGRYGKYSWSDLDNGNYDIHVLWTESKWSANSYDPFLYEVNHDLISRDDLGQCLIVGNEYIMCTNSGFIFYDLDTNDETKCLDIRRNDKGIDMEDRVQKLKTYLKF